MTAIKTVDRPWRELPVKTDQDPGIKQVLQKTADEDPKSLRVRKSFWMDNIFLGCLNGQLGRYGIEPDDERAVWIYSGRAGGDVCGLAGESYDQQSDRAAETLEHLAQNAVGYRTFLQKNENAAMVLLILYRLEEGKTFYRRYQKNAVPVLERVLEKPVIYVWGRAERLADVAWAVEEMRKNREWNLYFPPGTLISPEKISRWN